MARRRSYWRGFAPLAIGSMALLFLFVFGLMPQRFVLELDFAESGFAYPVIDPPLAFAAPPPPPPPPRITRPIPRGPAERFWDEYLTLVDAGDHVGALERIEAYLRLYPDDLDVALEYGRALWRLGRLEDAIRAYRSALGRGADPAARRELARLLVGARHWDEAASLYEQLVRESPGDWEQRREFARSLVWAERYDQAVDVYAALAKRSSYDFDLLQEYATAAVWAERYDLALPIYADMVELRPDDPTLRLEWARAAYWAGQPELAAEILATLPSGFRIEAVDSLRRIVEAALPPPARNTLPEPNVLERARRMLAAGAVDSALALYRAYLLENPGADSLLLEVADAFEFRANDSDSARVYLRAHLERQPDDLEAALRLARLLAWSGDFAEAERLTLVILAAEPDNAEALVLLGDIHRWRGDLDEAERAYREALAADTTIGGASEGLAEIDAQVDAWLATRGTIGPASQFELFSDNDDYRRTRLQAAWTRGSPRTRWGGVVSLEEIQGVDLSGAQADLMALEFAATAEHWWMRGAINATASAGAWIPDGAATQPLVDLRLAAPNWGGTAYRLEYSHGPAYRETATLEAAVSDLRADVLGLEVYRPVAERFDLALQLRGTVFSGVSDANLRTDGGLGAFFRLSDEWRVGYQTRGLAFSDAAPVVGRRLYWDPAWSWSHLAVVRWRREPMEGWQLGASLSPGVAWIDERDRSPKPVFEFGALFDAERRFGAWSVVASAGLSQSRTDGYRSFRLDLGASRGFGR